MNISLLSRGSRRLCELSHALSAMLSLRSGLHGGHRDRELIVSLTSIPERMATIDRCIDSLLRQTCKPDRLILWLSESDVLTRSDVESGRYSRVFERLKFRGLQIEWCADIGSYRKLIPVRKRFSDALIITADDDLMYPPNWLGDLYSAYQREPAFIHCHHAHRMLFDEQGCLLHYRDWNLRSPGYSKAGFDIFPTGGGGVLYAPEHLDEEVLKEDAFLSLAPRADDVWFKAMSLKRGVQCKKVAPHSLQIPAVKIPGNRTLMAENVNLGGNDRQIQAVNERYGVFDRPYQVSEYGAESE